MTEFYKKSFHVSIRHCDKYGRLKAAELFNFMQECAVTHANFMGVGMEEMLARNMTFVLSRLQINLLDVPTLGDDISILTYPAGRERLFYMRDFEITSDGKKVAEGRAMWIVINLKTRRPVRDREFGKDFPLFVNENVQLTNPAKPTIGEDAVELRKFRVGYSDVDILKHANSSRYLAWVCDSLGSEYFSDGSPYSIVVNYTSELLEDEYVTIYGKDMSFAGINETGGEAFSAGIERLEYV